MFEVIVETFPHITRTLRRRGYSSHDAAALILSARFGDRAGVWAVPDQGAARSIVRRAFSLRPRLHLVH